MFYIFPGLLHSRRDSSLGARLRDSERLSSLFFERSQLGSSPTWLFYDYHFCKYLTARLPQVFKCRKFSISSLFLRGFRATATGCRKFQVFQLVLSLLFSRQLSHVCRNALFTASDFEHIFFLTPAGTRIPSHGARLRDRERLSSLSFERSQLGSSRARDHESLSHILRAVHRGAYRYDRRWASGYLWHRHDTGIPYFFRCRYSRQ